MHIYITIIFILLQCVNVVPDLDHDITWYMNPPHRCHLPDTAALEAQYVILTWFQSLRRSTSTPRFAKQATYDVSDGTTYINNNAEYGRDIGESESCVNRMYVCGRKVSFSVSLWWWFILREIKNNLLLVIEEMSCDVINIPGIEYYVLCNICKEPTVSIGHTGLTWGRSYFRTILQP